MSRSWRKAESWTRRLRLPSGLFALQKVEAILQGDLEIIVTNANATKLAGRSAKALNGAERTQVAEMLLKNLEGLSEEEQQAFLKAYKERAARSSRRPTPGEYEKYAFGHTPTKKEFTVPWSNGRNHVRIVDDWIKESGIIQEATTIEWTAADVNKVGTEPVRKRSARNSLKLKPTGGCSRTTLGSKK